MKKIQFILISLTISFNLLAQKPTIAIADFMANDSLLASEGFSNNVESIARLISPKNISDEQFKANLLIIKQLKAPIYAFNIFIPAELKVVGSEINEAALLEYIEIVLQRISKTNTKLIVWGSGGSRKLPEGFDKSLAFEQFKGIAKKIAPLAQKYNLTIALENLNSTETNFINTVKEALYVVKKVNHPNFRLNVDIYHMLKEGELPIIIRKTKKYIINVEIAEKENRTAPGVVGTNFRPFLKELAKIGYDKKITIEGRWKSPSEIGKMSLVFLQNQIDEVYR
jgi:sugar phosphate isomerase/epimerase